MNHNESVVCFLHFFIHVHPTNCPSAQCQCNKPPTIRRVQCWCRSDATTWAASRHCPGQGAHHKTPATSICHGSFSSLPHSFHPTDQPISQHQHKEQLYECKQPPIDNVRPTIKEYHCLSINPAHHQQGWPTINTRPHKSNVYHP